MNNLLVYCISYTVIIIYNTCNNVTKSQTEYYINEIIMISPFQWNSQCNKIFEEELTIINGSQSITYIIILDVRISFGDPE